MRLEGWKMGKKKERALDESVYSVLFNLHVDSIAESQNANIVLWKNLCAARPPSHSGTALIFDGGAVVLFAPFLFSLLDAFAIPSNTNFIKILILFGFGVAIKFILIGTDLKVLQMYVRQGKAFFFQYFLPSSTMFFLLNLNIIFNSFDVTLRVLLTI